MAEVVNPFDLLGDDVEDPSLFIAAQEKLEVTKKAQPQPPAKAQAARLPSKPVPPTQAVREAKNEGNRGRGGRGRGRGRGSYNRESAGYENGVSNNGYSGGMKTSEEGEAGKPFERRGYGAPRGNYRGGRRGNYSNGDGEGERPRRAFDRRSGTGQGNDFKRDGAGRGNWGTPSDELAPEAEGAVNENEKSAVVEKQPGEEDAVDANKENPEKEAEEKEPEDKEMTLEEYEKILEEKRKALSAPKTEVRKVDVDKEFQSMQQLSKKANVDDDVFIKLGSDKEKRKDAADKEEKVKKSVSINEFLKPADGEKHYAHGGRGRGRGRGARGGYGGQRSNGPAPSIQDPGQFPSLGGK